MHRNHRYWFLRFIEGTHGANAGGASKENEGSNGGQGSGEGTDWEARAKELEAERDKWKGHARTWEDRAKENQSAASRLKEVEDGGKTDVQKLEEQLAQLQQQAAEREAELTAKERKALVATVAAEEGVSKDDFEFFPDSDDEEVLRKFAKRLAAGSGRGAESNNFGGSTGASKEATINRVRNL